MEWFIKMESIKKKNLALRSNFESQIEKIEKSLLKPISGKVEHNNY